MIKMLADYTQMVGTYLYAKPSPQNRGSEWTYGQITGGVKIVRNSSDPIISENASSTDRNFSSSLLPFPLPIASAAKKIVENVIIYDGIN